MEDIGVIGSRDSVLAPRVDVKETLFVLLTRELLLGGFDMTWVDLSLP